MKSLYITFEDREFEEIKKIKDKLNISWKELITTRLKNISIMKND